jgi:hypothetical protein
MGKLQMAFDGAELERKRRERNIKPWKVTGEMRATPRNSLLGAVTDALLAGKGLANKVRVPGFVPWFGGAGVGDLVAGQGPEMLDDISYGGSPIRGTGMTTSVDPRMVDLAAIATMRPAVSRGATLAKDIALGGLERPTVMVGAQRGAFLSDAARTAPKDKLKIAERMRAEGASQADIWRETGWWVPHPEGMQPPGGVPVWEIKDPTTPLVKWTPETRARADELRAKGIIADRMDSAVAALKDGSAPNVEAALQGVGLTPDYGPLVERKFTAGTPPGSGNEYRRMAENAWRSPARAADRYPHPELYAAHPELANTPMSIVDARNYRGEFNSTTGHAAVSDVGRDTLPQGGVDYRPATDFEMASVAAHEMSHAAHHRSPGMPIGGSPADAKGKLVKAFRQGLIDEETYSRLMKMSPYDVYQRLGSEALARLAQTRMERGYSRLPWEDLDIPADEIINAQKGRRPGGGY